MSIFILFLKNYWKQLVTILAIVFVITYAYNYAYTNGKLAAQEQCAATFKEYSDKLDKRIQSLEDTSKALATEDKERANLLKKDLAELFKLTKDKPLTVIREGKCQPSETFIDTYNAAIDRINRNE
jgi:septal ring factor EnvC (AmiA/AmiB activator)